MFDDMFDFDGDGELDAFEEIGQNTYDESFDEDCDRDLGLIYEGIESSEDDEE